MILNKKTAAIVIAYNPENNLVDKLKKFSRNLDLLVVYNNTENEYKNSLFKENVDKLNAKNIEYISCDENIGIASALNVGIKKCLSLDVTHIFLFDQDSDIHDEKYFQYMVEDLDSANSSDHSIVSLCPVIQDESNPDMGCKWLTTNPNCSILFSRKAFTGEDIYPLVAITSGGLFFSSIFNEAGLFRDEYFIDYVDTEYCLRLNRLGYKIKVCSTVSLLHNLGARTKKKLFGISFYPTNHSAMRRYYIARNSVDMWKRYASAIPAWALFDLMASIYNAFRIVFFESNKLKKIKYSSWGFIDGLNKKMGKKYFE
jgi:Predicted glycosyltransferases